MNDDSDKAVTGILEDEEKSQALVVPEATQVISSMESINSFQQIIQDQLTEGVDYSKPGLFGKKSKPSLLKAGAEKIMTILGCRPRFTIIEKIEDFDKPLFYYLFRCEMVRIGTDAVWGDGIGSCTSKEKRYVWDAYNKKPKEFSFQDVNTIQKMAQKRAMVASVLTMARLSNLFTQDIEDYDRPKNQGTRQRQRPKNNAPADPDKLTTTERKMLQEWAQTYPFVKEQLAGKSWGEITRDEYLEIVDKVKITEQEFGEENQNIDDDVPF